MTEHTHRDGSFGGKIHYITGKVWVAGRVALLHHETSVFGQVSQEENWSIQGQQPD